MIVVEYIRAHIFGRIMSFFLSLSKLLLPMPHIYNIIQLSFKVDSINFYMAPYNSHPKTLDKSVQKSTTTSFKQNGA